MTPDGDTPTTPPATGGPPMTSTTGSSKLPETPIPTKRGEDLGPELEVGEWHGKPNYKCPREGCFFASTNQNEAMFHVREIHPEVGLSKSQEDEE